MLNKLYVHNSRCLQNFELDLSGLTKVLGNDARFAELVGEGLGN